MVDSYCQRQWEMEVNRSWMKPPSLGDNRLEGDKVERGWIRRSPLSASGPAQESPFLHCPFPSSRFFPTAKRFLLQLWESHGKGRESHDGAYVERGPSRLLSLGVNLLSREGDEVNRQGQWKGISILRVLLSLPSTANW